MEFLKVEDLSFSYQNENGENYQALSGVNFSIKQGEYVAITGTNGSGKSTLARLVCGLLPVQSGKISGTAYKDEDFFKTFTPGHFAQNAENSLADSTDFEGFCRVPSGMVMQDPKDQIVASILKRDTVFGAQNLHYQPEECEKRAEIALSLCGILDLAERQSGSLSGGQKQKLALAGILALSPSLLVLDEALSMIDPKGREEILQFADDWHAKGGTVLSISHNRQEVEKARRVIFLRSGKLEYDGETEAFLQTSDFFNTDYHLPNAENFENAAKARNTVLQFKNISFAYPGQQNIFTDFNLSIKQGSLCALMGQSGCGKSTLFEIACGLLQAAGGDVLAKSRPVLALQDCVNALFEEFAADDVAYGPRKQGLKGKALKNCVKNAMESAAIPFETFADKPIRTLSGGQKRKVALAGIIALNADIFLFDEPTAGLDPQSCSAVFKMFRILCAQGKTVVFSTHRSEEAAAADRKIVISNGSIIEDSFNFAAGSGSTGAAQNTAAKDYANAPDAQTEACAEIAEEKTSQNTGGENLTVQQPFEEAAILQNFSTSGMGFYCKKETPVHKLPPLAKWLIMLGFMTCNLVFKNLQVLSVICAFALLYACLAKFPAKKLIKSFFAVLPWLCFFFLFQLAFFPAAPSDTILWQKAFICVTNTKIELSLRTILHFLTALFCLSVFMYSADEPDILDGMNALLKPFSLFGLPVQHVSLGMSTIFRFVPLLMEEAASIIKPQLVRSSGDFKPAEKEKKAKKSGKKRKPGFLAKVKSLIPIFVPLIIRTLKRAETFAEALEARYYH